MQRLGEIMLYTFRPDTGGAFLSVMNEQSVSLHLEVNIDGVWHGQSHHDLDCYGLIRAFRNMESHEQQVSNFYASDAWRLGACEAIVSRILETVKSVTPMTTPAVEAIWQQGYFNVERLGQVS
jgi:hypothetical protein